MRSITLAIPKNAADKRAALAQQKKVVRRRVATIESRAAAPMVARLLEPLVASLSLVDWPGAPEHADAADLNPERIRELVAAAHDVWLRR